MKNIIISCIMCASVALTAQEETKDSRNSLHLGIKAGLNYSNVYDESGEEFNADPKLGFAGGAFLCIPVGKYLGVQPEVLFSQKGFLGNGTYLGSPYSFSRTTSYIDIPLMVEFKPSPFVTLLGGPEYSYLINQTDIFKKGSNTSVQEQKFSNDNIRKNVLSGIVGLDINVARFVFGARYAADLQMNNGNGTSSAIRYKNKWLQGTVGVRF